MFLTKNNGSPSKLNGFTSPIFGKELATPITVHLSSNISLVLAKINKLNSKNLANDIKDLLQKKINHFEKIDVAGPGFLNFKLSDFSEKSIPQSSVTFWSETLLAQACGHGQSYS